MLLITGALSYAQPTDLKKIDLSIRAEDSHNVEIHKKGNVYEITTTGPDPYLFMDLKVPVDVSYFRILSFNSFNSSEILPLVIFVNGLDDGHLVEGSDYEVARTEGWTQNSFDLACTEVPNTEPIKWIRIRFGMKANNRFKISDPCLRIMNDQDIKRLQNKEALDLKDRQFCEHLENYLKKDFISEISKVKFSAPNSKVIVEGVLNEASKGEILLAEIPIWVNPFPLNEIGESVQLSNNGKFKHIFSRFSDDGHDRLLSAWAIVCKKGREYDLLSSLHYPDKIVPISKLKKVTPKTKKGLGGCPFDNEDMVNLGIKCANFNILLNQILSTEDGPGMEQFEYCGKTWYADPHCPAIKELDMEVSEAKKHNWMISAILLIPSTPDSDADEWTRLAAHPDREASAAFAMPNMITREGVEAYAAALSYLCNRYCSNKIGRIHHWIIHNEIQNGFYWTNAGNKRILSYMYLYQKSMRTVYNIARQYDQNAEVMISLDHDWNRKSNKRSYEGKALLDILAEFCHKEGNFQWAIAYHPYPQNIQNPRTWEDDQALFSFDTPFITPKNLEVLNALAEQPKFLYHGKPREIQLTEQGLNSPDYSSKSLTDQAAGMVYSWQKIENLNHIVCYYYHLWADDPSEGGLKLGLRKFKSYPSDPLGKKPIWYVVRAYATPEWEKVRDSYKEIIGIKNWDEIYYKGEIK